MNFNKIEQRFLDDVLQAKLDTPAKANLKVGEDEFSVIIIPQFSRNGYFEFRYFGTPAYSSQAEDGTISVANGHIFGVNPVMEKAWHSQEIVELELAERPQNAFPFCPIIGPTIQARVLVVNPGHEGRLGIHYNQINREQSTLKQVKFSLVDFIDFERTEDLLEQLERHEEIRESLESIQSAFPDATEFNLVGPLQLSLKAGQEWVITLTKEAKQTRGQTSHSGLIKRTDGKEFKVDEMNELLEGLTYFFTFVSCAYRHPTAIIGEDSKGQAVWGQVGKLNLMPRSTNWFNNDSDVAAGIYLEELFPKFWEQWQNQPDELTSIIESYADSKAMRQAGLPKEAVATSYSGLDVLANIVSKNPNPDDSIAHIHKVLKKYDIPNLRIRRTETPVTAQLGKSLGPGNSGPHMVYSVRNYVVHPLNPDTAAIKQLHLKHLDNNYSPYLYLHDLCQFYLEYLFLIGLCDWHPDCFRTLIEKRNT